MKCIYWNTRGFANSPTRLALKKLINQHNPDIVLLSEPWINFEDLPRRWLVNLNLKLFAMNTRNNNLPNLWCICKLSLTPTILASEDQHVTFTVSENNKTFAISAIYASTNYLTRRKLWDSLNVLQQQHDFPWCFIGDFNVILGAHEHRGRVSPARTPMIEFQSWSDAFNLIHLPTHGAEFTWHNGRGGIRYTEKRLDRVVCNQSWLDMCCVSSVSTLTRQKSDHFPLLLDAQLTSLPFVSNFKFMRMWTLHPECKKVVEDCWNTSVIGCPMFILSKKLKLLKDRLKSWNKDCFGNVHNLVSSAEQRLQQVQDQIQQNGHSDTLLHDERVASTLYEEALNKQ
jgi:hypothetical protein